MSVFSHAGVSKLDGQFKVRFANDVMRQKVLIKNGHTDIDIIELKNPMTKEDAVAFLLSIDFDNGNKAVRAALEEAAGKRAPKASKPAKAPKAKVSKPVAKATKTPVAKTTKAQVQTQAQAVKAVIAELEDAPF
jgi:hypothetical protein